MPGSRIQVEVTGSSVSLQAAVDKAAASLKDLSAVVSRSSQEAMKQGDGVVRSNQSQAKSWETVSRAARQSGVSVTESVRAQMAEVRQAAVTTQRALGDEDRAFGATGRAAQLSAEKQVASAREAAAAQESAATRSVAASNRRGKAFGDEGARTTQWGRQIVAGLAAIGAGSVYAAAKFQSSTERFATQAGATQRQVDQLRKGILAMAPAVGATPLALSAGMYHVVSSMNAVLPATTRVKEELQILRAAAQGAAIGGTNLEDTTYALASAMNALHMRGSQAKSAMASLNAIVGAGDMTMKDLLDALSSGVLPAAQTFKVSLQSLGAAMAVMGDMGIRGALAGTRLRMSIALLGAPSEKAAKLLEAIGMSSTEAMARTDAMSQLLQKAGLRVTTLADDLKKPDGLAVAMQDLKTHIQNAGLSANAASALISRAFGGGRSGAAIQLMYQNTDRLQAKFQQIGQMSGNFGADWQKTTHTLTFELHQVIATLEAMGIKIGGWLIPKVEGALTALRDMAHWLDQNRVVAAALGGTLATLGGVMIAGYLTSKVRQASMALREMLGLLGLAKKAGTGIPAVTGGAAGGVGGSASAAAGGMWGARGPIKAGSLANPLVVAIEAGQYAGLGSMGAAGTVASETNAARAETGAARNAAASVGGTSRGGVLLPPGVGGAATEAETVATTAATTGILSSVKSALSTAFGILKTGLGGLLRGAGIAGVGALGAQTAGSIIGGSTGHKVATIGTDAAIGAGVGQAVGSFIPGIGKLVAPAGGALLGALVGAITTFIGNGPSYGRQIGNDIADGLKKTSLGQVPGIAKQIGDDFDREMKKHHIKPIVDPSAGLMGKPESVLPKLTPAQQQAMFSAGQQAGAALTKGLDSKSTFFTAGSLEQSFIPSIQTALAKAGPAGAAGMLAAIQQWTRTLTQNGRLPVGATTQIINDIKRQFPALAAYLPQPVKKGMDAVDQALANQRIARTVQKQVQGIDRDWGYLPKIAGTHGGDVVRNWQDAYARVQKLAHDTAGKQDANSKLVHDHALYWIHQLQKDQGPIVDKVVSDFESKIGAMADRISRDKNNSIYAQIVTGAIDQLNRLHVSTGAALQRLRPDLAKLASGLLSGLLTGAPKPGGGGGGSGGPQGGGGPLQFGPGGFAKGGLVYAATGMMVPKGTDTVPAMLTPREFVEPVPAVSYYGVPFMEALRARKVPRGAIRALGFAAGGQVPALATGGSAPVPGAGAAKGQQAAESSLAQTLGQTKTTAAASAAALLAHAHAQQLATQGAHQLDATTRTVTTGLAQATQATGAHSKSLRDNQQAAGQAKSGGHELGVTVGNLKSGVDLLNTSTKQSNQTTRDTQPATAQAKQGSHELGVTVGNLKSGVDQLDGSTKASNQTTRDTQPASQTAKSGIDSLSASYGNLDSTVTQVLSTVRDNTNNALKALGVKPISFTISGGGKPQTKKAARGALMQVGRDGERAPDSVPLNLGGTPSVVAPGEQIAVFTRQQQQVANSYLAPVGGLPGLFSQVSAKHFASGGYVNPYKDAGSFSPGRIDEGFDAVVAGRVDAIGDSVVTYADGPAGWPGTGAVVYRLTDGADSGRYVYLAENITPVVRTGQQLKAGDAIANAVPSFPFTEMGWASGPNWSSGSQTLAKATTGYSEGQVTAAGSAFAGLLGTLGVRGAFGNPNAIAAVMVPQIKAPKVLGPDGMLKQLGQGVSDKVTKAANDFVQKQAPSGVGSSVGGVSGLKGPWNFSNVAQLWQKHGGPAIASNLAAHVAYAESGFDPNSNSGQAQGLWQINPSAWPNSGNLFDPDNNATQAVKIYTGEGNSFLPAWQPSQFGGAGGGWQKFAKSGASYAHGGLAGAILAAAGYLPHGTHTRTPHLRTPKAPKGHKGSTTGRVPPTHVKFTAADDPLIARYLQDQSTITSGQTHVGALEAYYQSLNSSGQMTPDQTQKVADTIRAMIKAMEDELVVGPEIQQRLGAVEQRGKNVVARDQQKLKDNKDREGQLRKQLLLLSKPVASQVPQLEKLIKDTRDRYEKMKKGVGGGASADDTQRLQDLRDAYAAIPPGRGHRQQRHDLHAQIVALQGRVSHDSRGRSAALSQIGLDERAAVADLTAQEGAVRSKESTRKHKIALEKWHLRQRLLGLTTNDQTLRDAISQAGKVAGGDGISVDDLTQNLASLPDQILTEKADLNNLLKGDTGAADSSQLTQLLQQQNLILSQSLALSKAQTLALSSMIPQLPRYEKGGPVLQDSLAQVHGGEWVVPQNGALVMRDSGPAQPPVVELHQHFHGGARELMDFVDQRIAHPSNVRVVSRTIGQRTSMLAGSPGSRR